MTRVDHAFRIEGLGLDDSQSLAARFAYRYDPSHGEDALANPPSTGSRSVDPVEGNVSLESYSPTIRWGQTDPDDADAAEELFTRDTSGIGDLTADMTDSQTTVPLDVAGYDDTVVHVDSEAIKLGTFDAGAGEYTGCNRDVWGLPTGLAPTPHESGSRVYDDQPYWQGRLIELIQWRDGDEFSESVEWTGYIRDVSSTDLGAGLKIKAASIWNTAIESEVGGVAPLGEQRPQAEIYQTTQGRLGYNRQFETTVQKQGSFTHDHGVAINASDGLFLLDTDNGRRAPLLDSEPLDPPEGNEIPEPSPVYEVAVFGERISDAYFEYGKGSESPIPTSQYVDEPHHVVSVVLAHLASERHTDTDSATYDVMTGDFGLGLGRQVSQDVVSQFRDHKIDHWVTGWGGEATSVQDLLALLFRWGYGLIPTPGGPGKIKRWGPLTVSALSGAATQSAIPGHLVDRAGYETQVSKITAEVGAQPWRDEGRTIVTDLVNRPHPDFSKGRRIKLEYPELDGLEPARTTGLLAAEAQFLKRGYEKLEVKVPHASHVTGVSGWELFGWVEIDEIPPQEPWRPVDGTKESAQGGADWTGQIWGIERDWQNDAYTLTLVIPRVGLKRERAPAIEIIDDNSAGNDDKIYCESGASQFDYTDTDNRAFTVGEDIHLVDGRITQVGGPYEITDIGSDGTGEYVQISGTFGQGDLTDLYAQPAQYDDYTASGTVYSGIDYPWVYVADSSSNLGSSDDDAHEWGL